MTAALALSPVDVFDALLGIDTPAGAGDGDPAVRLAADVFGAEVLGAPSPAFLADPRGVTARVGRADFGNWFDLVGRTAQGCARPVRLAGGSVTVNPRTGEVVERFTTSALPDAVLYKPCGSRLASVCPSCAETYRYDTYHLIAAGMRGGKGVPESVAAHPAVFVTLTAPPFGPVHSYSVDRRSGRVRPCRPRRDRPVCRHGRPATCPLRHHQADPCVGSPLCLDCYDHDGQVVWNAFVPKLWTRTIDALRPSLRRIAKAHGSPVKLRYAKVAEFQARGLVHLHAIFRLDGYDPDDPETVLPPPAFISAGDVCELIRAAASTTAVASPAHPDRPEGWPLVWGAQLDTRIIRTGIPGERLTEQHVAGYLAKYATKSTEAVGGIGARLSSTPTACAGCANAKTPTSADSSMRAGGSATTTHPTMTGCDPKRTCSASPGTSPQKATATQPPSASSAPPAGHPPAPECGSSAPPSSTPPNTTTTTPRWSSTANGPTKAPAGTPSQTPH